MVFVPDAILPLLFSVVLRVCSAAMAWRAIYSEPGREFVARDALTQRGIAALCPFELIREERRRSRGRGKRVIEYKRPYFQSYLFAETDEIMLVESLRGVSHVLDNGLGNPLEVPPREMRRLFDVVDDNGMISALDATRWSYRFGGREGDIFAFIGGAFAGYCGKITSLKNLDSRAEVTAEITILGSEREISVQIEDVGEIIRKGSLQVMECAAL